MLLYELFEARKPWLRITPTHLAQAKGMKCQVIVEMDATEFIDMTTDNSAEVIRNKSQRLKTYNQYAKTGENILMPFLILQLSDDGKSGYISGHEGRHRAAALEREGNGIIPVAICMKPGKDMLPDVKFGAEYHLTSHHIPSFIKGQYNSLRHDTRDWNVIQGDMQAGVRRNNQ